MPSILKQERWGSHGDSRHARASSLELHSNGLTRVGLMAILDSCAHLELLITRKCPNLKVDDALLAKCARVRTVTLGGDDHGCYKVGRTPRYVDWSHRCSICHYRFTISEMAEQDYDSDDDGFFPEYIDDYYDHSRYLNGEYVTDLDDHENSKMLSKRVRRYLKITTLKV